MNKPKILTCPILSIGSPNDKVCIQESCAWYMNNTKTCAMYIMAHNAILDIKEKQNKNN